MIYTSITNDPKSTEKSWQRWVWGFWRLDMPHRSPVLPVNSLRRRRVLLSKAFVQGSDPGNVKCQHLWKTENDKTFACLYTYRNIPLPVVLLSIAEWNSPELPICTSLQLTIEANMLPDMLSIVQSEKVWHSEGEETMEIESLTMVWTLFVSTSFLSFLHFFQSSWDPDMLRIWQ